MPLALIAIGLIAIVTAINGTFKDLSAQLVKDINGQFLYWILAVIIVGSIGYIPGWERPSRMFLALVIIGLIIANGGVFQKLTQALQQGAKPDTNGAPLASVDTAPQVGSTQSGSTGIPNSGNLQGLVAGSAPIGTFEPSAMPQNAQGFGIGPV